MAQRVSIETRRFGRVEASSEELIQFQEIPGFPGARRFVVRQHDRGSVFGWLISMDVPDLAFVIANPWHFFPDYEPPLEAHHLKPLGAKRPDEVEIVAIVTVGRDTVALNLAAPLVINPATHLGMQVVLDSSDYSTGALIPLPPRPPAGVDPPAAARPESSRG